MNPVEIIVKQALKLPRLNTKSFESIKHAWAAQYGGACPSNIEILECYRQLVKAKKVAPSSELEHLLKKQKTRTLSGIASISVLTRPHPCPGQCIYCPTEKKMPKSYFSDEPAVMRAILTGFEPYKQVTARLNSLNITGHSTNKIELIILGGSFSSLPGKYQSQFVARCFKACNDFKFEVTSLAGRQAGGKPREKIKNSKAKTEAALRKIKSFELPKTYICLAAEKRRNEKARQRIIGITIETRPDLIDESEIVRLRRLGVTRVELGVQSTDDNILRQTKRGHGIAETIRATQLLKDAGCKINYHLMPNLPGSTPARDLKTFKQIFSSSDFQPDMLKIYPCVLTRDSKLAQMYQQGKYKPYANNQLISLLVKIKAIIPPYVRIMRLGRDIPATDIIAGNKISNIRQDVQARMATVKVECRCIRCREIKGQDYQPGNMKLTRRDYDASGGKEIFLSFEDVKNDKILAFLRLRIPSQHFSGQKHFLPVLEGSALIREVHSYGQLIPVATKKKGAVQHAGLGKKLVQEAEKIARRKFKLDKIAVISGVGVRDYYRKFGYRLRGEYMVKMVK
ncbi:tRNA uridine(34) 5-carboxymethylaminomethyl modification radical SAM/GNAT enzyme Elp3 [Patescibacteria group bacterium]|nr:tRNA uridine(34) 5-carboxymethylaminomethyl modification radical SAM/GNAT enzyme Elp3 [Patescibacteria group bacterium]